MLKLLYLIIHAFFHCAISWVNENATEFEGDIVLDPAHKTQLILESEGTNNTNIPSSASENSLWPNGMIPYEISNDFSKVEETLIEAFMLEFHFFTCIKFHRRTVERDYIRIVRDYARCKSHVGVQSGMQKVWLKKECLTRNTVLHELMHVLGFWHEQSRYDRDEYIEILEDNIDEKSKTNFLKFEQQNVTHSNTPYDYNSVMHYGIKDFSKNGFPTIRVRRHDIVIKREGLSVIDKLEINILYNCINDDKLSKRYDGNVQTSTTAADPIVVQPPEREKSVCMGQIIVITCRAVGVPVPNINWRLNWGPVCGEPRCTQTSINGLGTMTIRDSNFQDQGAYTCEAVNVKKRILAQPDSIVTVRDCNARPEPPPAREPDRARTDNCNEIGTQTRRLDGSCVCKPYVTGPYCERCSDHCYNLAQRNPNGCIRCFCSGVTRSCQSSDYYRSQERLTFRGSAEAVTVSDFQELNVQTPRFDYDIVPNSINVSSFSDSPTQYWRMPAKLLDNKITAYGGQLKFTIQYSGYGTPTKEPLVVLKGSEITLVYRLRTPLAADRSNQITIDMFETSWNREDGHAATHEHLLMTLADLETFLIKQTHCQGQSSSSLGEVVLDIATPQHSQQEKAHAVEKCDCPEGYIGLSCEDCTPGYERSGGGLYLGTCVRAEN